MRVLAPFAATILTLLASRGSTAEGGKLHRVTFDDPVYGVKAASLEIPARWQFAGTVARPPGCTSNGAALKYTAQSPDGLTAAQAFPGFSWTWSSDPMFVKTLQKSGCAVFAFESAAEFLKQIAIPQLRAGAQLLAVEPPKAEQQQKLDTQLAQMKQQTGQMAAQYGQKMPKLVLEGASARIRIERGGQPVEERISTVIQCTESQMLGGGVPMRMTTRHQCSARYVGLTRAPAGQFEKLEPLLNEINKSLIIDPAWSTRLSDDSRKQAQSQLAASQAAGRAALENGAAQQRQRDQQHAQFMQQQQDRVDRAQANDRATQAATDRAAKQEILDVQGRGTYVDPGTGRTTETSSQYGHVWQSGDGSTTLHTNDPTFDPNGRDNQTWTELQPTAPR